MSHTIKTKVNIRDVKLLEAAVRVLGGEVIGDGKHQQYSGRINGWGFKLPGWRYPLAFADGELSYDDFGGVWGNRSDIGALTEAYALEALKDRAAQLGWMTETTAAGMRVYHPSGGMLDVTKSGVEATNFVGGECSRATQELLGDTGVEIAETQRKQEFFIETANVQVMDDA